MKSIITTILLLTLGFSSKAQVPNLTNWKIDTLPTGDRIYPANHSRNDWTFVNKDGEWQIIQNVYSKQKGDAFPFSEEFIDVLTP